MDVESFNNLALCGCCSSTATAKAATTTATTMNNFNNDDDDDREEVFREDKSRPSSPLSPLNHYQAEGKIDHAPEGRRRAVLIGIQYAGQVGEDNENFELPASHSGVKRIKNLLKS
jgi:hypothetical protein